jgi:hypothetical protein
MTSGFKAHGMRSGALSAIVVLAAAGSAWPAAAAQAAVAAGQPAAGSALVTAGVPAGASQASRPVRGARAAGTSQPARVVRPPGREWASFAYDPRLHELVLFGGDTAGAVHPGVFRGTWTRAGATWTKRHPARSPSARTGAAMVYDAATGQLLLFGGGGGPVIAPGTLNAQTWVWTGRSWRQLHPTVSPSARQDANMVYDAARREVILYGGFGGVGGDAGTWAWNGATWTLLHPASSPGPLWHQSMAYDSATKTVILFGGNTDTGLSNQTWSWDGTTWTLLHPAVHPRDNAAAWQAAYDPASKQLILAGQDFSVARNGVNEIWDWTGTSWRKVRFAAVPGDRTAGSMTYDSAIRKIVLFGGTNFSGCQSCIHPFYPTSMWVWNGRKWSTS